MIDEALNYLHRASIIPLNGKIPAIPSWKEFQTRKATPEEVTEWWTKNPNYNIGIVTGHLSNITVVDVDQAEIPAWLPKTAMVKTGKGWHFYYQYEQGVANSARVRENIDIRGEGGYVVAPPSIHPTTGKAYEWVTKGNIQPFPSQLFGVAKARTNWDEMANGAPEGQRNESAAKYIGKLMQVFSPDTWENTVWETAKVWNLKNSPPLDESELRHTYESIQSREMQKDRPQDKQEKREEQKKDVSFLTFTEVLALGKKDLLETDPESVVSFGYPWLDEQLTGIFPGELVIIGGESGTGKTTFATNIIYKASQDHRCTVFALEDRLADYAIKSLFFEVGRLRREAGCQKRYFWNDFRKNEWRDDLEFRKYLDLAENNLKNDKIFFAKVKAQMDVELLEELIREEMEKGTKLFLIDHLHYFNLSADDKSSKADYIEKVMVQIKTLQNDTGARIIMIVHYKKLEGKRPTLDSFKDSVSIVQNANYVINLYRDRSNIQDSARYNTTIHVPKSRNPNGEGKIEVVFNPNTNDYSNKTGWNQEIVNSSKIK